MKKTWKRSKTDILVIMLYYPVVMVMFHIFFSIFPKRRHPSSIETDIDNLFNFPLFIFTVVISTMFISPIWVLRTKIPKSISLNTDEGSLTILQRRKPNSIRLKLENVYFHYHSSFFFSVLIFYKRIPSSKGHHVFKQVYSTIAPNIGLSWNKKVLSEIKQHLNELEIPVQTNVKSKTFWRYLHD